MDDPRDRIDEYWLTVEQDVEAQKEQGEYEHWKRLEKEPSGGR